MLGTGERASTSLSSTPLLLHILSPPLPLREVAAAQAAITDCCKGQVEYGRSEGEDEVKMRREQPLRWKGGREQEAGEWY